MPLPIAIVEALYPTDNSARNGAGGRWGRGDGV
jgi:hypothetical protein